MQYNRVMQNIYQMSGNSLEEQYFCAGMMFRENIVQNVQKIAKGRSRLVKVRRAVAEKAWDNLQHVEVAREFCSCLRAWSHGAAISPEQAMWLLADNLSGCQTVIARLGDGVALLHSEEEFRDSKHTELHMPRQHTLAFGESRTLIYDNLMPGCGLYGWKPGLMVAADTLFLREDGIMEVERPVLANVISWLIWRMSSEEASPERVQSVIEACGELIDGYAINVVRRTNSRIEGYKLTLARSETKLEMLPLQPGEYLRQANIVDPSYPKMEWALPPRQIWRGGYKYFLSRCNTMDKHAKLYRAFAMQNVTEHDLEIVHTRIQDEIFGPLRSEYVSPDVGAICVGIISAGLTSVSCRVNSRDIQTKLEYLEVLD